ncbi:Eco29kI family restriction endonuclease [Aeromicrobium sp. JJY06]|uniref:Eco29kI family restriction endonuclease n=1 Tax=Aeromicrobium sp. JJY06 TaxID=3373478 RepID=UPI00376EAB6D
MTQTPKPFNPLDMEHLGESVGNALLSSTPVCADQMSSFTGAGVYAVYYVGDAPPYEALGAANADVPTGGVGVPIYVGKADPPGGRKGLNVATSSKKLYERLHEHRRSVTQAKNLECEDFYFRWLVVEPIWVPLGETVLLQKFAPVWNSVLDGFGNHAPGSGRDKGELSLWDTLHPGRNSTPRGQIDPVYWADTYKPNSKSQSEVMDLVRAHLASVLPAVPSGAIASVASMPTVDPNPTLPEAEDD